MKAFFSSLFTFLFISSLSFANALDISAKQAIILDYETGQVLFEKNADERMPTSSMSKVLTAYAVMMEIKEGNITLKDEFMVSEKAWKKAGSKMFVKLGTKVSVEDLLKGVIVQSGNDATIVLAEGLAGSEEKFAEYLNKIAQKLGMTNSHFTNASGWPAPDHYSTARDLAKLAYHAIKDFPDFYGYYAQPEFSYNNITQQNRNPLLSLNIGADGIKTGHTESAGYGLMASALHAKEGRRVIVVINGTQSKKSRAEDSQKLVTWALNGFKNKKFIDAKTTQYKTPVLYGKEKFVITGVKDDLILTVEKLSDSDFTSQFKPKKDLIAPIKKGDMVGRIDILKSGKPYKSINVIAKSSVEELGAVKKFFAKTIHKFKNRN